MKVVAVIVSGAPEGENVREVEVQPGTTAGDVLRALNLGGYLLSREGSGQHFAEPEDIYHAIEDGAKLRATPTAEVGERFWDGVLRLLGVHPPVVVRTEPGRARVTTRPPSISRAGGPVAASPDNRPLWEIRGWRRQGNRLVGAYRTPFGSFAGEIHLAKRRPPEFFIVDAPASVLQGPHSPCFRTRPGNRHFVHFGLSNPNVDAGIVAIEKIIIKALKSDRKKKVS